MSWYDYLDGSALFNGVTGSSPTQAAEYLTGTGADDPTNGPRAGLNQIAQNQQAFGQQAQNNYNASTGQANQTIGDLRDIASGKNSVSAIQLQQAAQANQAQQASMAAAASPNNQAMAARNAMMNAGRIGYGLAGQQSLAGIQERNAATGQLAGFLNAQRGQDVNAALGAGGNAVNAYGQQVQNPQKTTGQQLLNAGVGLASAAAAKSDRRAKTDIEDGDDDARSATDKLKAFAYKYKDPKDGKGKQLGPMAQDMEKAGLGHAVINTPGGKYVHGAKAALSSLALVAALGKRVAKLEGGRK
jgi:hypothetical protein